MDRLLIIGALFVLAGLCEIGGGYLQGALDSIAQREEAYARALERRSRFGVVGDP